MGGIASKLMRASMAVMEETFDAEYVSLHVRYTNRAAFTLYSQTLGFEIHDTEKGYYADKEDAYDMRKMFEKGLKKQKEAEQKKTRNVKPAAALKDNSEKEPAETKEDKKDKAETDGKENEKEKDADDGESKKKGKKKKG